MRIIALCTALFAAGALAVLGLSLAGPASAANHCVQYPAHDAYLCVAGAYGGALYWDDNLSARTFDWHPSGTLERTDETFFCARGDRSPGDGHVACQQAAPGTYTGEAEWTRRTITLADGCRIVRWNVLDTNAHPPAPIRCSLPDGSVRATTTREKQSVLAFWKLALVVPGKW